MSTDWADVSLAMIETMPTEMWLAELAEAGVIADPSVDRLLEPGVDTVVTEGTP